MSDRIYTTKDILQKDFKAGLRGYNPVEVDEFLDNVIRDYEDYNKEIAQLKEENERLLDKLDLLEKQRSTAPVPQATPSQSSSTVTNFDILKRLSNLEKHVFGSKLTDDE